MEHISKKEWTMLLAFSILKVRNEREYSNIMLVSSLKGNSGYWEQGFWEESLDLRERKYWENGVGEYIMRSLISTHSNKYCESYVYWTVHHLDSWVKRDQLDVTFFIISLLNAQRVSDVSTSIIRSLRLICWVISWVVLLCIRIQHHHSQTTT